jgi:hypothetical protein
VFHWPADRRFHSACPGRIQGVMAAKQGGHGAFPNKMHQRDTTRYLRAF